MGIFFAALLLAGFVLFGALRWRLPTSIDEPAMESEAQATTEPAP
jgi:hypothetical protein